MYMSMVILNLDLFCFFWLWQHRTQREYLEKHKIPMLVEYARLEAEQKVCFCSF